METDSVRLNQTGSLPGLALGRLDLGICFNPGALYHAVQSTHTGCPSIQARSEVYFLKLRLTQLRFITHFRVFTPHWRMEKLRPQACVCGGEGVASLWIILIPQQRLGIWNRGVSA